MMNCLWLQFLILTKTAVTNAAGGLNQKYEVGDIVLLKDVRLPFS